MRNQIIHQIIDVHSQLRESGIGIGLTIDTGWDEWSTRSVDVSIMIYKGPEGFRSRVVFETDKGRYTPAEILAVMEQIKHYVFCMEEAA